MTQLDQLESEAAAHRTRFADAVDGVRARVGATADDLREKLSPGRAIRHAVENWRGLIEERARENPIQLASAAILFGYPAWRLVRALPLPVLVAGAGVLLSSKARFTTTQASDLMVNAGNKVREIAGRLSDATLQAGDGAAEQLGIIGARGSEAVNSASEAMQDTAQAAAAHAKTQLTQAADSASAALSNAVDAVIPSDATIQSFAGNAWATASAAGDVTKRAALSGAAFSRDTVNAVAQNPLLIAGLGIVAGGFLAALLPRTRADSQMLGSLARTIRNNAQDALREGHQTATAAILDLQERAADEAETRGLTAGAIQEVVDDLNERASNVAAATKRTIKRNAPMRENHHD